MKSLTKETIQYNNLCSSINKVQSYLERCPLNFQHFPHSEMTTMKIKSVSICCGIHYIKTNKGGAWRALKKLSFKGNMMYYWIEVNNSFVSWVYKGW